MSDMEKINRKRCSAVLIAYLDFVCLGHEIKLHGIVCMNLLISTMYAGCKKKNAHLHRAAQRKRSLAIPYRSSDGQLVKGCIAAVNKVIQLTLNIIQQRGSSHAEQVRLGPLVAELVFHQSKPHQRVLGAADTSSRLEADFEVGSLIIITNGTNLKTV